MPKRSPSGDDVASWIKSGSIDSMSGYLCAGRIHQNLSTDELVRRHIDAIRVVIRSPSKPKCWLEMSDFSAELTMREEPLSDHEIAELENLYAAIDKRTTACSSHPELGDDLLDKFTLYLSERDKGH